MQQTSLAARFKTARKFAGLTQEEAAHRAGVEQGTVSKLENGTQEGTAEILSFAKAFGVDPFWLGMGEGLGPDGSLQGDTIRERLKAAREFRKLEIGALSESTGLTYQAIRAIETGETKDVTGRNAFVIADALGVEPRWLVTGEGAAMDSGGSRLPAMYGSMPGAAEFRLAKQLCSLEPSVIRAVVLLLRIRGLD